MNYLQLVQRLRLEAQVSGTRPTTVVAQSNTEYARLCNWVADADVEIQLANDDWRFMWRQFSFQTSANDGEYTEAEVTGSASIGVAKYDTESFRYYLTASWVAAEQPMTYLDYLVFRDRWLFGNTRSSTGQPSECTFLPYRKMKLAPKPDGIYTVTGDFYRDSVRMALDADTPLYPAQFHMLPVWWALVKYGGFEESSFIYTNAQNQLNIIWNRMQRQERPLPTFGGPLA